MRKSIALISILFLLFLCSSASFAQERLLQESAQGNEISVKTLLTDGAEVDMRDEIGNTPLIIASDKGYLPIVQLLIKSGADVNAQNNLHWTALMFAAGSGDSAIVAVLLEKEADPNTVSKSEYTALILASAGGYAKIVDLLLEKGADAEAKKNGMTARQWAEKMNNIDALNVFERFSKKP
ncbi:MAG: ankyrin repeat domain-containing protein [Candidatus Krumholzibacteriota bacterium]|nr:ankyrin repeat domain-containing protein [Candidatus Krumholzibacteriota bacterium]